MNKNVQKRVREFVEQEKKTPVDQALLDKLRGYLVSDTLYWRWPAEKRNAFNVFFRELADEFTREIVEGEYGSHTLIESMLVTAFEVGWWAREEGLVEEKKKTNPGNMHIDSSMPD